MKDSKDRKIFFFGGLAIVFVVIIWLVNLLVLKDFNHEERGTYGDMFGAANTIFSGLAFAFIIISIYLQNKELKVQNEDIKLQIEELTATRKEFNIQNMTLRLQRFENTFFNLVSLHHEIVSHLKIEASRMTAESMGPYDHLETYVLNDRDVFKHIHSELRDALPNDDFDNSFANIYTKYRSILEHYFNNLQNTIQIIDSTSDLDSFDNSKNDSLKKLNLYTYVRIIISHLSYHETMCLFYYGISEYGKNDFKPLIEKYGLLQNISHIDLIEDYFEKEYAKSAYENKGL